MPTSNFSVIFRIVEYGRTIGDRSNGLALIFNDNLAMPDLFHNILHNFTYKHVVGRAR